MDCSVQPLRQKGLSMISTTDFFFPLVDDPYMQGMIGAANVLSDLYSMGVTECDTMLMILAASLDMTKKERDVVTKLMMRGFSDQVKAAGSKVSGGQSVLNPWAIIGGIASSVCSDSEFIMPEGAVDGDVLVLTKPLGTQVAVNVSQWRYNPAHWSRVEDFMTKEDSARAMEVATESMARLNRNGARMMQKYGAHGATDVTGFGILGHATNLASNQKAGVNLIIDTLPIIKHMKQVDEKVQMFSLLQGFSAETSGGLLVCLPASQAELFCKELQELDGQPAWIVGKVVKSDKDRSLNTAMIVDSPTFIEV